MSALEIFAIIAALLGIAGSIIPAIPGPPISWIGMLLIYIQTNGAEDGMSQSMLFIWLVITILVTVVDYMLPPYLTKLTGGHKAGTVGTIIGLTLGMFIPPVGIILGGILGAFLGELIFEDNTVWGSFKVGMGAFLGFISTTVMKLIVTVIMAWDILSFII